MLHVALDLDTGDEAQGAHEAQGLQHAALERQEEQQLEGDVEDVLEDVRARRRGDARLKRFVNAAERKGRCSTAARALPAT